MVALILGGRETKFQYPSHYVQDMRVDHRRLNVLVAQHFLNRANVVASLDQMRGDRVPQCVRRYRLCDSCRSDLKRLRGK